MFRKNSGIIFIVFLMCVILQSCTQSSESDNAKNANTNQAAKGLNLNSENNTNFPNVSETNNNVVPGDNSANKKQGSKVAAPQPVIGSGGDDLTILLQARNKLSSDQELINRVIVEVKQGNVALTGKVLNGEQKKKAEQLVQSVQGIKSIKNNLSIAP